MKRRSRVLGMALLRDAREGVAAVEFALLASGLILLFTGAASLGLATWAKMQVGNAARAGTAYAAYHAYSQANIQAAAQNATILSTNVTVTSSEATMSCIDPATGSISPAGAAPLCLSGSPPGNYVTVTTTMPYSFIIPLPGLATTMTLRGQAFARVS